MLRAQDCCKLVISGANSKNQYLLDGRLSLQSSPTTTGPSLARPSQLVGEQSIQEVVPQMDNNFCRKSLVKDSTIPFTEVITHCLTINHKSCLDSRRLDQEEDSCSDDLHQIAEELVGTI